MYDNRNPQASRPPYKITEVGTENHARDKSEKLEVNRTENKCSKPDCDVWIDVSEQ